MKKRIAVLFVIVLLAAMFTGCGQKETVSEEGEYYLYYTNINETGLQREVYEAKETSAEKLMKELLEALTGLPKDSANINLLTDDIRIENYKYENGNVELNMCEKYGTLARNKEVLIRAGLVRTLTQIQGVNSVSILVAGDPLTNSKGVIIGRMKEESFVENTGREINSYQNTTLSLYFTDSKGEKLVKENRKLYYSSNVLLERVVVEQIVKGPKNSDHFATVPSDSTILGVTVADGICYVNMGKSFVDQALGVHQSIPIYSIVNSLIDNCNVSQVQISVEGESDYTFRESMDLNQFYKKNTELIQEGS